ncbi:hypothetical protein Syun_017038 [Stephania yunnanensis]|uniref:Uncharacterized protein n=1 Tax=Stephania yunnanensis TaxID=152371 RepID=A0AAP0J675_9MAGN
MGYRASRGTIPTQLVDERSQQREGARDGAPAAANERRDTCEGRRRTAAAVATSRNLRRGAANEWRERRAIAMAGRRRVEAAWGVCGVGGRRRTTPATPAGREDRGAAGGERRRGEKREEPE